MCESGGMAQTVNVIVAAEDRERLLAIAGDRNRPLKHVQRARIILLSAERLPVAEVARRAGVSRPAVWRWQRRYGEEGIDSLLRDKTRKPGRAPLSTGVVAKVLASTCSEPPGETTHWTGRAMAKAVGISLRAVQRLWEANRLQPHRLRTFKRSNDPKFAEKVEDVVGLYMDPPAHAVVVSIEWVEPRLKVNYNQKIDQHDRKTKVEEKLTIGAHRAGIQFGEKVSTEKWSEARERAVTARNPPASRIGCASARFNRPRNK